MKILCVETSKEYVKLYPWFYMPASVHKLLIHSTEIISAFSLYSIAIGAFSEEAQESRNKDNKIIVYTMLEKILDCIQ